MTIAEREWVRESDEMVALFGAGAVPDGTWPDAPIALAFNLGGVGVPATVRWHPAPSPDAFDDGQIVLIVSSAAIVRLFGALPQDKEGSFHISADLRAIALAIRDCAVPEGARKAYRLAKSVELLCETLRLMGEAALVPALGDCQMSQEDSRRILAARRIIDEQWSQKLTLDQLSRACGLNRAKLTRGFRDMFDCSIADALSEQRLEEARRMLLSTDLPVASIGYRCGYLNNASFTRAFSRRFGIAPTHYRARRLAA